jgi:prephenate dehydrogenase
MTARDDATLATDGTIQVTVVGAGLLGGSLLAGLQPHRRAGSRRFHLTAVSSASTLDGLRRRDWCDALHTYEAISDGCVEADIILLCTPLATIREQITTVAALRARLRPDAIVMDVGSTKRLICEHGFAAFPVADGDVPRFVGGHPMAGSEKSGLEAADPMLYQSALWVLCPPQELPPQRLQRVQAMIAAVGARTATLDPALHDDAVARISHVPQLLASALSAWAGADARLTDAALTLAAGGFRDMTRLALSSWDVWRDIIADGLRELSERLRALAATTDDEPLHQTFADGRALRQRFHMPRKGILHDLTEFVVRLEDRPGALLSLFTPLAAAAINVQDLEILKVREGESGTILLGFAAPDEAGRARALLGAHGFATFDR